MVSVFDWGWDKFPSVLASTEWPSEVQAVSPSKHISLFCASLGGRGLLMSDGMW